MSRIASESLAIHHIYARMQYVRARNGEAAVAIRSSNGLATQSSPDSCTVAILSLHSAVNEITTATIRIYANPATAVV